MEPKYYEAGRDSYHNRMILSVDISASSNLDFTSLQEHADALIQQGKHLIWDLQFDLDFSLLEADSYFSTLYFGLETFLKQVLNPRLDSSDAVIGFRGEASLFSNMHFNGFQFQQMKEWVLQQAQSSFEEGLHRPLMKAFQISMISDMLHRLCCILPDEIPVLVIFDHECFENTVELATLLSKRVFPYLIPLTTCVEVDYPLYFNAHEQKLFVPKQEYDSIVGFALPEWENFNSEILSNLQKFYQQFQKENLCLIRMVPEELFMEEWEDLSKILISEKAIGDRGRRMLQGFLAADGEVISEEHLTPFAAMK